MQQSRIIPDIFKQFVKYQKIDDFQINVAEDR